MSAANKLKGINYKEFFIDHVEKFVMGVILLVTVMTVFSARWSGYEREPRQLKDDVDKSEQAILSSEWPEGEKEVYANSPNIIDQAKRMQVAFTGAEFEYSTAMSWPLYEKEEPFKEPTWLPVDDLIASAGWVTLAQKPEQTSPASPGQNPSGAAFPTPIAQTPAADPDFADPDFANPVGKTAGGGIGTQSALDGDLPGTASGEGGVAMGVEGYGGQGMQATGYGRGARYVAVRGIFNWRKQVELVARALNEPIYTKVANLVDVFNFELERQVYRGGTQGWSQWEPVDLEVAQDIIDQAADFDRDPFDNALIHDVMTMPLPRRIGGIWGYRGSHPQLRDFRLSEEEMRQEDLLNKMIIEEYERKLEEQPKSLERGGFARQQHNIGGMRRLAMGDAGSTGFADRVRSELNSQLNPDQLKKLLEEDLKRRASAVGRLLLYRYLDFNVEPGNAYRYRVRLVLMNPNYGRAPEEVEHPDMVVEMERKTPWSEPTQPVVVPVDVQYYLADITAPRARPDEPVASFDVYQWNPETGTMLNEKLQLDFGQFIGGTAKSVLIDPPRHKFEEEAEVTFKTDAMLVDMSRVPSVDDDLHPDLNLSDEQIRNELGMADQALVVNRFGELETPDTRSERAAQQQMATRVEKERELFAPLKKSASAMTPYGEGAGELEALAGDTFGEGAGMTDDDMMQQSSPYGQAYGASPIRKSSRGRRARTTMPAAGVP